MNKSVTLVLLVIICAGGRSHGQSGARQAGRQTAAGGGQGLRHCKGSATAVAGGALTNRRRSLCPPRPSVYCNFLQK